MTIRTEVEVATMQVASSALAAVRGIEPIGEAASRWRQESALPWSRTPICVAVAEADGET